MVQLIADKARVGALAVQLRRELVVGLPTTVKVTGLPCRDPLELDRYALIAYNDVVFDGVLLNVNVEPPLLVVSVLDGSGTVKSELTPVVGPLLSFTVIVHWTAMSTRTTDGMLQLIDDHAAGAPNTGNGEIELASVPPDARLADTEYDDVVDCGVTVNVNAAPKLSMAIMFVFTGNTKSVERAVDGPFASDTAMPHDMPAPARAYVGSVQLSVDCVVGMPYTWKVGLPLVMVAPMFCTVILYAVVIEDGVTVNVYVFPESDVVKADAGGLDMTVKSELRPVVALKLLKTVTVHENGMFARAGDVQVSVEAVVGVPNTRTFKGLLEIG